ncbi:MAG: peptide chain release factor 2 [Oscillospiraceae bacterium]|nr:peptide chain release factor 2 [Oscillospiraceae bacterium]
MLQFEELRLRLEGLLPDIEDLAHAVGIKQMLAETEELDARAAADGFWDDMDAAQKVVQKTAILKAKIESYNRLVADYHDAMTLIELANEEEDASLVDECTESVERIAAEIDKQRLATLLTGEYDAKNAILTFHAGAGGTEAQDWAEMLYRMYTHWAESHGFQYKILDYLDGDEAGLKSASIEILGTNVYGYLKGEAGVHRLVRISPFDSSGRRHTSFAALEVIPEIDDTVEVDIRPEDIKMDVFRSSGAGGQHINKTSTAVRLTHIPTGIVVACQNERSQFQNRDKAMSMLKSKLVEIKEREHLERIEDIKGSQSQIAWGSQIRSYVFMPYTLAKDHRTGFEMGNIQAVMDGEIDGFINAYLKAAANGTLGYKE